MKKTIIMLFVFLFILGFIYNASAQNKSVDGKLGTGYATDPKKLGWQLNLSYMWEFDPFFGLGFEPGIFWANWDRKIGTQRIGVVDADLKADTNAYCIPLFAEVQVRLPNLEKKIFVLPYFSVGLGYSFMILNYSQPEYISTTGQTVPSDTQTKLFHGLSWQLTAGAGYSPGSSSKIRFIVEIGYRGLKLQKGDLEVDMSGFIANIGIRYPIGSGSASAY